MINKVILTGRLVDAPELRYTPSNKAVATARIACPRDFKNQNGERESDFFPLVIWGKKGENFANWLKKGFLVTVEGRLQTRSYDNSQGQKVYVVEVICDSVQFLETRAARERAQSQPQMQQNNDNFYDMKTVELEKEFDNSFNTYDIMEDDIQF